ncbi:PREDICTED: transcription initiation factor TFIID subunit 11b-like [Lupinus angustifolius]|uniref:transcription initiation factor TFIID subunit 11b-like n=1 Tax=Lupinus angustifolius TaxID=3871 RepID=UPI00092FC6C9|nr:PREDICTED: transcription initiation factor TFIID subunit 11b-like [Lupinus angustifolius]
MKLSKDPFEAAFDEQDDSPLDSPSKDFDTQNPNSVVGQPILDFKNAATEFTEFFFYFSLLLLSFYFHIKHFPNSLEHISYGWLFRAILSQFTEEQMSRYESFRRAGFQKANMKRLLANITGIQKTSVPMTIVVSGIAKLFVGEVVETARIVMKERKESGPIRPCHLREAYRHLKLEGKVFKRSGSRLFR